MKKTKILSLTSLLLVLVCALMAFTFTACGSKVKITLSQTEITVAEGGKANIVATVAGSTEELTWEIDNNEVAEFNTIGKMCIVTAKKLGTAKITASIGKAHAECKVTVTADTTEKVTITLDGAEVTEAVNITSGESKTFAATASNRCLFYTSPGPTGGPPSRMPSSALKKKIHILVVDMIDVCVVM